MNLNESLSEIKAAANDTRLAVTFFLAGNVVQMQELYNRLKETEIPDTIATFAGDIESMAKSIGINISSNGLENAMDISGTANALAVLTTAYVANKISKESGSDVKFGNLAVLYPVGAFYILHTVYNSLPAIESLIK